jgi:hypothetical protein
MDKYDPWGSRRYRIFGTEIRDWNRKVARPRCVELPRSRRCTVVFVCRSDMEEIRHRLRCIGHEPSNYGREGAVFQPLLRAILLL